MYRFIMDIKIQSYVKYANFTFTTAPSNSKKLSPSAMDTIRDVYTLDINRVIEYYRESNIRTKSNHIVAKILNTVFGLVSVTDRTLLNIDIINKISDYSDFIVRTCGLTTTYNVGNIHTGNFSLHNQEIFLVVENSLDYSNIEKEWLDMKPLRPLRIPNRSLDFSVFQHTDQLADTGPFLFELELTTLVLQYRYWFFNRVANGLEHNIALYINTVLTTNILIDKINLAYLNNILDTLVETPLLDIYNNVSVYTNHRSNDIQSYIEKMVVNITTMKTTIAEALMDFKPIISVKPYIDMILPSNSYDTYQTNWVYWYCFIDYAIGFLTINKKNNNKMNYSITRKLPSRIKAFENGNSYLFTVLSEDQLVIFKNKLNELKKLCYY